MQGRTAELLRGALGMQEATPSFNAMIMTFKLINPLTTDQSNSRADPIRPILDKDKKSVRGRNISDQELLVFPTIRLYRVMTRPTH